MDFVATLTIPATQTRWWAHEVPALTAAALHPVPDAPEQPVRELLRLDMKEGRQVASLLSEYDRQVLAKAWEARGLPAIDADLTAEAWVPYLVAFNEAPDHPDWQFAVMPPKDPLVGKRILLVAAEEEHKKALRQAIDTGLVDARSPLSMSAAGSGRPLEGLVLTRSALAKFCESLCIRVVVAPEAKLDERLKGLDGDGVLEAFTQKPVPSGLEQALRGLQARKNAAAELAEQMAPEIERLSALRGELDALPQHERRQVLDAMGLSHVSAAPAPLATLRGRGPMPSHQSNRTGTAVQEVNPRGGSAASLLVQVAGRDALPVRAISYVTGWCMSPDDVAKQLAKVTGEPFARLQNTPAYFLNGSNPTKMLPKEWDRYVAALAGLEADLRGKYKNNDLGYSVWRTEAAGKLPAGVFVWRDEFEKDYERDFSRDALSITREREGERELTYSPMLEDELRALVLAGFVEVPDDAPSMEVTGEVVSRVETETPCERRARRLRRFRELGGDMHRAGTGWHSAGKRGALAELVRGEAAAGRPMSDKKNVREDLIAALGDQSVDLRRS